MQDIQLLILYNLSSCVVERIRLHAATPMQIVYGSSKFGYAFDSKRNTHVWFHTKCIYRQNGVKEELIQRSNETCSKEAGP